MTMPLAGAKGLAYRIQGLALLCLGLAIGAGVASYFSSFGKASFVRSARRTNDATTFPVSEGPGVALLSSPSDGLAVASAEWEQAQEAGAQKGWPRWRAAWLAGVCADSLGKVGDAATWMRRFQQSFDPQSGHFPASDVLYLEIVASRLSPARTPVARCTPLGLFCFLADAEPDPFPQVVDELKKARQAAASGGIVDRVRLMSWLLLAGELVVEADTGTPAAGLLRNAVQAFDEGFQILEDVEKAISDDPSQESMLTSTPDNALIAMRFDAVRVRQAAIRKREVLAKEKEFERLDALRQLIAAEKSLMGQVGRLSMATMDRDWSGAQKAGEAAIEQIALTQGIARQKRDYYLLDEPKVLDTNDQWKALDPPVGPVSSDIVSTVKILMGLASAQLAETQLLAQIASVRSGEVVAANKDRDIAALLDTSESLVERATKKVPNDPADGFDPENAIAPYVRGVVAETRARLATYRKLGDGVATQGVAETRQEAIEAFKALKPLLEKWGADVTASYLIADAQRRITAISDATPARQAAATLSQTGRAADAWSVLGESAELHASKEVAVDRADAARRSRRPGEPALAELDRAIESRMIPDGDLQGSISRAALVLQDVGTALAKRDNARQVEIDKKPLSDSLETVEASLRKTINGLPANAPSRPRAWAWLALCLAYRSQVADDATASANYVKETQRLAQDALFELTKAPPAKDAWDPGYVEAVVAAQLALGHAAAKTLPSHRDESRLAFAAAIDNAASLPFVDADFRMLGSPLLAALASGDSGGSAKLAQEERALRQMMTRFVEASFALRFGSPQQAASQMAEAVAVGNTRTDETKVGFDASAELNRADGFDVHISLPDSIRAFAALSQITAGESVTALRTLISITSPGITLPAGEEWVLTADGQKMIGDALAKIQSPLAAYAMAAALEMVVDHIDLSRVQETQPLLRLAANAQKHTDALLAATRVAGRYPHIQELSRQLALRLQDPKYHQENAASSIAKGDVVGAIAGLRSALRRQPKEQLLWEQLFALEIARHRDSVSPAAIQMLRDEINTASALGLIAPYQQHFYTGELFLLERNYTSAAASFDRASSCTSSTSQKTLATARATASRLRISQPPASPNQRSSQRASQKAKVST